MNKKQKLLVCPLAPLREVVIFPGITATLYIGRELTLAAVEKCLTSDNKIVVVAQKTRQAQKPLVSSLYTVGTLGKILQIVKLPHNKVKILFEAHQRVKIKKVVLLQDHYSAEVQLLTSKEEFTSQTLELTQIICKRFYNNLTKNNDFKKIIQTLAKQPALFCDFFASTLNITLQAKQQLLEEINTLKRIQLFFKILLATEKKEKLKQQTSKNLSTQDSIKNKKLYSQDQIKILGEEVLENKENPYIKKIKAANLPENVAAVVLEEVEKLNTTMGFNAEGSIIKNYIDWIFKIPWHAKSKESFSLKKATTILNRNHYGLAKIKERILEFIAVIKVVGELRGPILCLVGPPGVGKSSLAKTIAESLGREFCRISLGGVRDEAEIRGHRRTYIGAMPGKIIQAMKKAKTINPLILLDEIDKTTISQMGSPAAALLEVLDREQNHSFMDHYLDLEYDLSKVLFFCTANNTTQIPTPLLDRMELIALNGYTELEKTHIFKKHLLPKIAKEHGLTPKQINIGIGSILKIIQCYTRESGIRELERNLAKICRKIIKTFVTTKQTKQKVTIRSENLKDYLGVPQYSYGNKNKTNLVGVATGLAWTNYGGDLILIEVSCMKGKANIQLTGQLGEVMQESAKAALSFVKSNANNLGIYSNIFQEIDIHIHIPEGATPKDGPSAGVTLIAALVSNLTGIALYNTVAMTGEISLRGRVLAIGGLHQKLLAAKRAGITDVIIPLENEKDLADIPAEILQNLKIHCKNNIWEILEIALARMPQIVKDDDLTKQEQEQNITNSYLNLAKQPTSSVIPPTDKLAK